VINRLVQFLDRMRIFGGLEGQRFALRKLALEPDPSHLERIPNEESGSDLLRSNEPDAVALSCQVESPQSVVQGCPTQGSAIGPGEKESR
jgi:hypothetical protein